MVSPSEWFVVDEECRVILPETDDDSYEATIAELVDTDLG